MLPLRRRAPGAVRGRAGLQRPRRLGTGLAARHPAPRGAYTFTTSGTTRRRPFPGLDADEQVRHKGELVYPNLFLSLACDHAAVFILQPRSPTRTDIACHFLFEPFELAKPDFDPRDTMEFWDLVNRQDWSICESVQQGMQRARPRARLLRADGRLQPRHPPLRPRPHRRCGRRYVTRPPPAAAVGAAAPRCRGALADLPLHVQPEPARPTCSSAAWRWPASRSCRSWA